MEYSETNSFKVAVIHGKKKENRLTAKEAILTSRRPGYKWYLLY